MQTPTRLTDESDSILLNPTVDAETEHLLDVCYSRRRCVELLIFRGLYEAAGKV
jgi:hypothetical protein